MRDTELTVVDHIVIGIILVSILIFTGVVNQCHEDEKIEKQKQEELEEIRTIDKIIERG